MQISDISRVVGPTLSRQLYMLAKQYDDVIDFTLGDPDIHTPVAICEAANKAAIGGQTRYAPNAGIPELRDAIAAYYSKKSKVAFGPNNVAVTVGATEAIYLAFNAILNQGDEVIIFEPYWVQYENIVRLFGAKPVIVSQFADGFVPEIDAIESAVTEKTKVIIINSPNNPSGQIYDEQFLRGIARIAVDNDLYVFADEVYCSLVYEDEYPSIVPLCPKENLVVFNSFSKQFAMTGWRVGYVLAESQVIDTIVKLQQNIAVCASTISQKAAYEAIIHAEDYSLSIKDEFLHRRDVLVRELEGCLGISYNIPQGTFYLFLNISVTKMDSKTFCFSLLSQEHVATIPGIAFGVHSDSFVRLAFTLDDNKLVEGAHRIKHFLSQI